MPVKISSYIRCCRSLQETLKENVLSGRAAPVQYLKELRVLLQLRYDSNIGNCIIILTEPTTPLIFHAQPGGIFLFMGCFMYQYPKQRFTIISMSKLYASCVSARSFSARSWSRVFGFVIVIDLLFFDFGDKKRPPTLYAHGAGQRSNFQYSFFCVQFNKRGVDLFLLTPP